MGLGEVDLFARRQFPEKNSAESCYLPNFPAAGESKASVQKWEFGQLTSIYHRDYN